MTPSEIICIEQKDFHSHPLLARLLQLHDIPKQLYIRGTLPNVTIDEYGRATPRVLTVVGSRKHTRYGKLALEKIISSLNKEEVIILSGLALGIDSLAHQSALSNTLQTIAVPGSGIATTAIYPASHKHLAENILDQGGVLLSEFPPDTKAAPWTFPARNRVMAALSDAVLVAEAEEKSGTLITARQALELGRDIGAIPGEILSPTSLGTNLLIRDGAYMIATTDDIYSLLHLTKKEKGDEDIELTADEKSIVIHLTEPLEKDALLIRSKLAPDVFMMTLSTLELKGIIEETFGEVRKIV